MTNFHEAKKSVELFFFFQKEKPPDFEKIGAVARNLEIPRP